MDRDLQNAVSHQAGVEIEREMRSSMVIGIGYQYTRGRQLLMSINQNVPTCVAAGNNNGCRPYPEYGNNNRYSSAGSSSYHGMHVSLTQRPGRWGNYRLSYTLSSARNNVGEFFFSSPIDPFDLSKDWGRSDNDQRHRLVLSGTAQSPTTPAGNGWETLTRKLAAERPAAGVLGATLQYHVGGHDHPGHGGPSCRRWSVHRAQRGGG